mmetsp:Transcript_26093/g.59278  ORF Transcript_26093/g.59278 Transcript_26093/m.59278 type:complete len:85 (-) Transcript_26093:107-361(-)
MERWDDVSAVGSGWKAFDNTTQPGINPIMQCLEGLIPHSVLTASAADADQQATALAAASVVVIAPRILSHSMHHLTECGCGRAS